MNNPDSPPASSEFGAFLLPERLPSLKLYFDNIRNYAISASIVVGALYVAEMPPPTSTPTWPFALVLGTLGVTSLVLNIFQTALLFNASASHFAAIRARSGKPPVSILMSLYLTGLGCLLTLSVLVFFISVANVAAARW